MSIGLSFEAQIQDVSEAREEVMDLAEQWNIAAFPDENSVSLSFCPIGILEIQFEQEEANQWIMSGECVTTPAGPGPVSYTHLRAHETGRNLVCRLLLEKKKKKKTK